MADTLDVLNSELRSIAKSLDEVKGSLASLCTAMANDRTQVARLEERHLGHASALERAFEKLTSIEQRIQLVELEQPVTKMVRGWVIAGFCGFVSLAGAQLYTAMTLKNVPPPQIVINKDILDRARTE